MPQRHKGNIHKKLPKICLNAHRTVSAMIHYGSMSDTSGQCALLPLSGHSTGWHQLLEIQNGVCGDLKGHFSLWGCQPWYQRGRLAHCQKQLRTLNMFNIMPRLVTKVLNTFICKRKKTGRITGM